MTPTPASPSGDVRPRPKIALAAFRGYDPFSAADRDAIHALGDVIDWEPLHGFRDERAGEVLAEAEILLGHWGCPRLDADALRRAPRLAMLAYAAGTVKSIVTPAVFERGVRVTSGAPANAVPVAEYTLAVILLANKNFFRLAAVTKDPTQLSHLSTQLEPGNRAKRVGLIGASLVGRRVIELLRPFELEVVVADPFLDEAGAAELGVGRVELDELLRTSEVVSLHAPILESTIGMIGRDELALLRDGATFVNTARGVLVDFDALTAELTSGRINAVLDVTDPNEPLPQDWAPRNRPNVVVTPHIAGAQGTEVARLNAMAIEEIRRYVAGEPPAYAVVGTDLDRIA